jgi:methionyl-tRNA formyltransferase
VSNPYLQPSIIHTGWELNLPVLELRNLTSALTTKALASQPADIAVVACYPFRLPPPILALPSEGFLNLHPSLLPELRGPYPLFWTFRLGKQQTGLTVHYMDSDLDSGDIVLQKKILLPDGIGGPDADALLAQHGASMLALACRSLRPRLQCHRQSQETAVTCKFDSHQECFMLGNNPKSLPQSKDEQA